MRRAALGGALIVLLLGALIAARPFVTRDRDLLTTTPQPSALTALATISLRAGQQACLDRAVLDDRSEQMRIRVGTSGRRPPPLGVTIRGRGYRERARVPAGGYVDSVVLGVPIAAPDGARLVTVCVRNEGRRKIVLYAANDRTRSRSTTRVDGRRVAPNFELAFAEARPDSLLDHLPVILRRLTAFRPVGQGLLWPLAILFALGLPAAVLTAYVRAAGSVEAEDAEAALAAAGAAPIRPLRERHPRLARAATTPHSWLVAIVAATFLYAVSQALALVGYFVMPQELGFVKQAAQFASGSGPSGSSDMWFTYPGQLWSLVLAPVYGLFETPTAFDVAHALAAAAIASAAIPAYLLAGRVVDSAIARLLAAALTVAVPWLAFSGSVLAESLAYPLFVWALLACSVAIERPSPARDAIALGAVGVAFLTRPQLAALAVAFVIAAVLHELTFADGRRRSLRTTLERLSRHAVAFGLVGTGLVLLVAGVSSEPLLGDYAAAAQGGPFASGMLAHGRELLAYVSLGVAVLPLALAPAWIALELTRPRDAAAHAFAALALATLVTMVAVTTSFSVRFASSELEDRYLFYIAPLLMIGAVALLFDRRAATLPLAFGGALAAAVLGTAALGVTQPSLVSPTFALNTVVQGRGLQIIDRFGLHGVSPADLLAAGTVGFVVALALARRRVADTRWIAIGVSGALLLASLLASRYAINTMQATQVASGRAPAERPNWVDRATAGDDRVGAVVSRIGSDAVSTTSWWYVSFWNKRIDRVWQLPGSGGYAEGFSHRAAIDPRTGRIPALDEQPLLLLGRRDRRFALRGARLIARQGPFELMRAPRPYRASWTLTAARDDGLVRPGRRAQLTLFGDGRRERRLRLRLSAAAAASATRGYVLVARRPSGRSRTTRVPQDGRATLRATVRVPAHGAVRVRLTVRCPAQRGATAGVIVDPVVSRRG